MSHEISSMMYAGETPWHGLGVYVGDEDVDSQMAITAAGLDWEVDVKKVFFSPNEDLLEIPNKKVVYRTSDNKAMGIVTDKYHPVQNKDAFSFMDSLVEDGSIKYHTAGSLRGGKNVWILAKIGSFDVLKDDQVDKYLLLYNSHDGTGALRCFFTATRVVCANTASIALSKGRSEGLYLRHTPNIVNRTVEARKILNIANTKFNEFENLAKRLTNVKMTDEMMSTFANTVFQSEENEEDSSFMQEKKDNLVQLFSAGIGQDIPNVRGTGWAAYSALVEYTNYHSIGRGAHAQEKRFENSFMSAKNSPLSIGIQTLEKLAA
jgi:phage/plasmid-like protein (TIGR03299 family)